MKSDLLETDPNPEPWIDIFNIGSVKAIYKSIKNSREYPTQEEKKRVVEQFQDHYLLKVN